MGELSGAGRRGAPYRRIVEDIRGRIRNGEFAEGGRIPSQSEMVQRYGVTRATVQKAIAALVAEGLVVTRAGSGVYVRSFQRIVRSSPRRLQASWWGTGHAVHDADTGSRPRTVNIEVGTVPAPAEIAEPMGVAAGT